MLNFNCNSISQTPLNLSGGILDHIVYLDKKAKEDEKLLSGSKSIIIRGAAGRKTPYSKVFKGDNLYFINNDGSGQVFARTLVTSVFNSEKINKVINKLFIA